MTRLRSPPSMVNRASQLCLLLGASPSSDGSQMLQKAKQEVPSLELGPPSPDDWINQLVGSPSGGLKPATRVGSGLSLRYETTLMQLTPEAVVGSSETLFQESPQTRHRPVAPETSSTSCEFRKRTKILSSQSPSNRSAKRRRVVPSGAKTPTAESEELNTALTAEALSETFLAPSTMDMERDATDEFMNEFWSDLMLDTSPVSNDSLITAACPFDELRLPLTPLPAARPDSRLLDDVTEDQLLELAEFLEPRLSEADTAAALAELAPAPGPSEGDTAAALVELAPAPATAETPVVAPIDLAALLEQTEIIFSPEPVAVAEPTTIQSASLLLTPACSPSPPPPPTPTPAPAPAPAPAPTPAPTPTPTPAASAAEPTHYLLVLSVPEPETPAAAAVSATSDGDDSADDPEFDDAAEAEVEVVRSNGPARKRAPRRPPAATPAEKYRRIRDNNNEASRRSRQQRKVREGDTEARAAQLEEENGRLRQKAEVLEGLLEQVKALVPLLTAKR